MFKQTQLKYIRVLPVVLPVDLPVRRVVLPHEAARLRGQPAGEGCCFNSLLLSLLLLIITSCLELLFFIIIMLLFLLIICVLCYWFVWPACGRRCSPGPRRAWGTSRPPWPLTDEIGTPDPNYNSLEKNNSDFAPHVWGNSWFFIAQPNPNSFAKT